jgi:sodium-dependent dicarboxylate transporter 2/3/5
VTEFIGLQLGGLSALHPILLTMLIITALIFLTEITSNTATAAAFLPILGGIAVGIGIHPYMLLIPATVAVSYAFMLPVATPPNALVFASERVTIPQMCKAGIWLNLMGIILITLMMYFLLGTLLGIDLSQMPSWAS